MPQTSSGKPSSGTKTAEPTMVEKMQEQISDRILPMFDAVTEERSKYYQSHAVPERASVQLLINGYGMKCGSIAAACNLVPGPWGLLAIAPEIAVILNEQLKMIYDIGRAYGHKAITKELLLGIALSGSGTSTCGLMAIVGGKVIVKRASLRLIQKLVAALGGKVAQKVLKSMLAKWVPFVGAAAMGLWAQYSTRKLGQQAVEIFSKDIVFDEALAAEEVEIPAEAAGCAILVERARLLVALSWVDRRVHERESGFVAEVLKDPDLPENIRGELLATLGSGKLGTVNFDLFKNRADEQIATIVDMIALAKTDNDFHPAERTFIRDVGRKFGLPEADVEEMLAFTAAGR